MAWKIDGDTEAIPENLGGYDGSGWRWGIVSDDGASTRSTIIVKITGTALAMGEEALSVRAALGRKTHGKSEVEGVLDWPMPPTEIEITSEGVSLSGGDPGWEQLEIAQIMDWFTSRGATIFFVGRGFGHATGRSPRPTKHSAYVAIKGSDNAMFKAEGLTYLEAARAAKQKWEDDGLGVYLQLQPAEGKSTATLQIETGKPEVDPTEKATEARQASRSQCFGVSWEPLPGSGIEGHPVHLLQVTDGDGNVVDIVCGDDPEDSLLEVAEHLLPSWHGPPGSR